MAQNQQWMPPMSAFPRPESRQSPGAPATNYAFPPPSKGTPPANGGNALPPPPSNPPPTNSQFCQPSYSGPQFAAPPTSASPPVLDHNAIKQYNEEAYQHNAAIGKQLASSQSPASAARMEKIPGGAPAFGEFMGAHSSTQDDIGTFNGGSYRISHRDTNSLLTIQLAMGCPLTVRPGAMIAMSPTITLRGAMSISLKKFIAGGSMSMSHYTGPGELLLAPSVLGDVIVHRVNDGDNWKIGRDAFLAHTSGVHHEYKAQSLSKGFFSGEGFFVYHITGTGLLWMQSFGAIIKKDLIKDEVYIVDNGHLVAWNCDYEMTRPASGGLMSSFSSGEGLACKFKGPGTVYLQTRNLNAFAAQMKISTASG
ncbi:unnamed protein product [Penicillium salamii]|uniref:Altered inheritance of mitochondria protein 24, mitochondrial n=1 Tax=Penicillium salamii TaxID=1612424 RepID=A0A9W4IEK1_9EURO|nr:unnamed protein product [Penicillium salamii]CAG8236908.1 unnamed protein product [Penicillium salamii]CAG8251463.1 unnamed protein product [Penicillium salamii]CAG8265196.1 unnamed protein product [Penicillium salamii]CAG8351231.1 unnamed protein product [Penicillium salamii]